MGNDISKYLGKSSREADIIAQFNKLVKKAIGDNKKIRELEHRLLKPKPLPPYHGPKTGRTNFKQRSLLLVFKSKTYIERFKQFVKINTYGTNNTYHVELFVELIKLLEDGRLEFSYEDNRFYVHGRKNKKTRIRL